MANPTWIRVTESNSTGRPWYGSYGSKAEALREAKKALAGCVKHEGRVEVYDCNPRDVYNCNPIKVLRA